MLTFAEEILLLSLDDETGKFFPLGPQGRRYPLAGAVLMDLALRGKIDNDLEKVLVVDTTPTGEALLDGPLAEIAAEAAPHDASFWIERLAGRSDDIEAHGLQRLIDRGIVRCEEKRILWVFETRRYPTVDDREEKEVKRRLLDILLSDELPTPRDVVLICLVDACDLLPKILSVREVEHVAPRVAQLRKLDLLGQAMTEAMQRLQLAIAKAAASTAPFC
jgi:golgi phosphoprotein 3